MRENITQEGWGACTDAAGMSFYTCQSFTAHIAGQIREAGEIMADKENRTKNEIAYAGTLLAEWVPNLAKFKDRQEFLDKRLDHALKCLKRKKLWAPDTETLMAVCEDRHLLKERGMLQILSCTMDHRMISIGKQSELDDNCWRIGIDMAMTECEPDLARSISLYGPALERNICRIFADTWMAASAAKVTQLMDTDNYRDLIEAPLIDRYFDSDQFHALLEEHLAKPVAELLAAQTPDDAYTKHLESELEKALQANSGMAQQQAKSISKAVAPVQARAEKLAMQNAELSTELSKLKDREEALMAALADRDRQLSVYNAASGDDAGSLPELPYGDVIFAGGHPNMTKKLRQDHPGWTFISGSDVNFPEFRDPAIIFFWDKHMCHPMWHRVRKFAHPSVPQAYLKSTNLDMLEAEMRRAWAAAQENEARGGGKTDG